MKVKRIDEYHKNDCHFFGKLAVVYYLDDAKNDPKWGTLGAEVSLDYLSKAMTLIKERYGTNFKVLLSMPDLVVNIIQ